MDGFIWTKHSGKANQDGFGEFYFVFFSLSWIWMIQSLFLQMESGGFGVIAAVSGWKKSLTKRFISVGILSILLSDTQNNNLSLSATKTSTSSGRTSMCAIAWRDNIAARLQRSRSILKKSFPHSPLGEKHGEIGSRLETNSSHPLIDICWSTYRTKTPRHWKPGKGSNADAGPGFWCVSLTQDVNMAVLNIVDALLDGLVTAHI